MKTPIVVLVAFLLVLAIPFALRNERTTVTSADDTVIILTPHPESIRLEFGEAFSRWYEAETGRTVLVDWRTIGGTSEIVRYFTSEYVNSFQRHWRDELGQDWSGEVQSGFQNRRLQPDDSPEDDSLAEAARRAWLASEVTCGVDIFFGGGSYDFNRQAQVGTLVPSRLRENQPTWFGEYPQAIPQTFAGEEFYDAGDRWYGAVLSTFGIIFNRDALTRLGIERDLRDWTDLADPRLFREVAVADPTKSGSATKAFEMIVQVEMQRLARKLPPEREGEAVSTGWRTGMQTIQRILANARYVTDSSTKPNIDVSLGDAAAGMAIDFYGRYQQEVVMERGGGERFAFVSPPGGSTVSVDPIGLFRGAPNREVAERFIEFVLSLEGQRLWNHQVGQPGGPQTFALRRPPIRPELYREGENARRSDPTVNPYEDAAGFVYRGAWTGPLFSELRYLIRVAFIDVHEELRTAWAALIENDFPPRAKALFEDITLIDHAAALGPVDAVLDQRDPIASVRLAREIATAQRERYHEVIRLARAGE